MGLTRQKVKPYVLAKSKRPVSIGGDNTSITTEERWPLYNGILREIGKLASAYQYNRGAVFRDPSQHGDYSQVFHGNGSFHTPIWTMFVPFWLWRSVPIRCSVALYLTTRTCMIMDWRKMRGSIPIRRHFWWQASDVVSGQSGRRWVGSYCFGQAVSHISVLRVPYFSKTPTLPAIRQEFWMIEPRCVAFNDITDNMDLAEEFTGDCVKWAMG